MVSPVAFETPGAIGGTISSVVRHGAEFAFEYFLWVFLFGFSGIDRRLYFLYGINAALFGRWGAEDLGLFFGLFRDSA